MIYLIRRRRKKGENRWRAHVPGKYAMCSAWPKWYIGWSCGRYGLGVVRETWGWRIMLGWFHLTAQDKVKK